MSTLTSVFEIHHTHNGTVDPEQVAVVFSQSKRLIVEAPAGYGKTKTMVSRIAYLIMSDQLPNAKKILALTFSVNASYKIKKEIFDQVRNIFEDKTAIRLVKQRVETSNFHGFGRRVLSLYGYLIHPDLGKINQLRVVDETNATDLNDLPLDGGDKEFLYNYAASLQSIGKPGVAIKDELKYLEENQSRYLKILLENFIPHGRLTYNGILLFTLYLFENYPHVASFYREYFPIIFVDEFQDTNWLQWKILSALTGGEAFPLSNRHLYLFGDRVQRIYGFIGAIPKIFDVAKKKYQMEIIKLNTNHRFDINSKLGKIDRVVRANAENVRQPQVPFTVEIPISENASQAEVGEKVLALTQDLLDKHPDSVIAILVRTGLGSATTSEIHRALSTGGVKFFFALYKEDDQDYIEFHRTCLQILARGLQRGNLRSFKALQNYMKHELMKLPETEINSSLATLLTLLMEMVQKEYTFSSFEEKTAVVFDTLANRGLKQHLDLVKDARVVLATVHGAKGLEWDFVIIPDVQKSGFPPAKFCFSERCSHCSIDWKSKSSKFEQQFLEELSVFYVAVTRARKDVYLLYSKSVIFKSGRSCESPLSCLAQLPGLARRN
jgi:DNA helicase II / ATP-dependent DNA helicase PcrA